MRFLGDHMGMGSARGLKRRRTDKKSEPNASSFSGSSEKQEAGGCSNNLSKSIDGMAKSFNFFFIFRSSRFSSSDFMYFLLKQLFSVIDRAPARFVCFSFSH